MSLRQGSTKKCCGGGEISGEAGGVSLERGLGHRRGGHDPNRGHGLGNAMGKRVQKGVEVVKERLYLMQRSNKTVQVFIVDAHLAFVPPIRFSIASTINEHTSEVMFDSNHKPTTNPHQWIPKYSGEYRSIPLDQVQSHPFLSHDLEHLLLASLRSA
jgi:hypothetical protein